MITRILNQLWLGDHYSRKNINFFRYYNINVIINCSELENICYNNIKYLNISIEDNITERDKMFNYIIKYSKIIHKKIKKKCNILVHCNQGISRSPCIIAGYLILYHNFTYNQAITYINFINPYCFSKKNHFNKVLRNIDKYRNTNKIN